MLTFDCTQAASDFFLRKANGKLVREIEPVSATPLPEGRGADEANVDRWQLHVTKLGRSSILIAMKLDSRYTMLFVKPKRNDISGFLAQFRIRLLSEMVLQATNIGLHLPAAADLQPYINDWEQSMSEPVFFSRSDRSVLTHINQVVDLAAQFAHESDGLPAELPDLMVFDGVANRFLRKVKGGDYFHPDEAQLQSAYPRLGGVMTADEVREAYRRWRRIE
jgi:hypothetical protein